MRVSLAAIAAFAVLALSACERRETATPAPEAATFSHRLGGDISGEYPNCLSSSKGIESVRSGRTVCSKMDGINRFELKYIPENPPSSSTIRLNRDTELGVDA